MGFRVCGVGGLGFGGLGFRGLGSRGGATVLSARAKELQLRQALNPIPENARSNSRQGLVSGEGALDPWLSPAAPPRRLSTFFLGWGGGGGALSPT